MADEKEDTPVDDSPEEPDTPEVGDSKKSNSARTKPVSRARGDYPSGRRNVFTIFGRSTTQKTSTSQTQPASVTAYILLILLAALGLFINTKLAYDPLVSFIISLVQLVFFFIVIFNTPERQLKLLLVVGVGVIDILMALGLMSKLPFQDITSFFITFHVFGWFILSIILFLFGIFDALGAGEELGKAGWLFFLAIIGAGLFFFLPAIWSSPLVMQQGSHAEYYQIAQEQLEGVSSQAKESKVTFTDIAGCFAEFMGNPTTNQQQECRRRKAAERFCEEGASDSKQVEECVREQLASKNEIAAPAIQFRAVQARFVFDYDYFPRTAVQHQELRYPASFEYKNFPETVEGRRVAFSCVLTELSSKKNITGRVEEGSEFVLEERSDSMPVTCVPEETLNGKYELVFTAFFPEVETFLPSTLFFIKGGKEAGSVITALQKVEGDRFVTSLARHFDSFTDLAVPVGSIGVKAGEPIVHGDKPVKAYLHVRNDAKGEITELVSYSLMLNGLQGSCLQNQNVPLLMSQRTIKSFTLSNSGCPVTLPAELKDPTGGRPDGPSYQQRELTAAMRYSYTITAKERIEVLSSDATG